MKTQSRTNWLLVVVVAVLLGVWLVGSPEPLTVGAAITEQQAVVALESRVVSAYADLAPSVVNITNESYVTDRFGRQVPTGGTGSGFVYDRTGNIVTNYHVVENATKLTVTLSNGDTYEAELVGEDALNDLAVIKIDAGDALPPAIPLANSDQILVGQFVLAIGNPYGLQQTLTTGVVSALERVIDSPEDNRFIGEAIQTDAAINPGNSGGPLINLAGEVIGVNSQIISSSGSSSGIGFAVSVKTVKRVVPELIARGAYAHPWLGAQMLPITPDAVSFLEDAGMEVPVDSGLLIASVVEDGPADKAGIVGGDKTVNVGNYRVPVGGDIITAVDGVKVTDFEDLTVYLETRTTVGSVVELDIIRDGQAQQVLVTLGEQPAE